MIKPVNDIQLSKNFRLKEFESPDTHEVMINPQLLTILQFLRDLFQLPIIITSGYRTPEHNKKVGGHPDSKHMKGEAADIASAVGFSLILFELTKRIPAIKVIAYREAKFIHIELL